MTTPAAASLRPSTSPIPLSTIVERIEATSSAGRLVGEGLIGEGTVSITGITHDSRAVVPGDLYAALAGARHHGAEFVDQAKDRGAVAVLTDGAGEAAAVATGLPVIVVDDVRRVLGAASAVVYGDPSNDLAVLGITGTNGKTTTAYLLDAALRACGRRTGLIGTITTMIDGRPVPSVRTTPEATDLQALLAVMRDDGVDTVVMEVSSHALVMGRVDGVRFDVVGFTNLSQDHLDFHGTMEAYFAAKAGLFTAERARRGVVMVDPGGSGRWARQLVGEATVPVVGVVREGDPHEFTGTHDVRVITTVVSGSGLQRAVVAGAVHLTEVSTRLVGSWNLTNAVLAAAMAESLGVDVRQACEGIASVGGVPGRLQKVASAGVDKGDVVTGFVDYAHTPDAVDAALAELRDTVAQGRRLVAVLGCGGDRDRTKRSSMGAAAARHADIVIVTDDNPRSEEPATIREAVLSGARSVGGHATIMDVGDRRRAIEAAVRVARPNGVIAVLGKGHETGQEVAGVITPFDDLVVLQECLDASVAP